MIARIVFFVIFAGYLSAQTMAPPDVPADLKVPDGLSVITEGLAVGTQIYTCHAAAWTLKAPDATLYDSYGQMMAKHFAGPTWLARDGSRITAVKEKEAPAPNPNSIPWLKLKATPASGNGVFGRVSYVQRVLTGGGTPPDNKTCTAANEAAEARSEYVAIYFFWGPKN